MASALASPALIRATDSVNKPPGPTQRAMMKRAYETFLVHGRLPSDRSPPCACFGLVWFGLECCLWWAHCNTRVTQDMKCIRTYLRPASLALSRAVPCFSVVLFCLLLGAGLADSQTELEDHSMGFRWPCTTPGAIGPFLCCPFLVFVVLCWLWLGGGLTCAPALVSSPRRIELNRMFQVMYGAPPTLLSFTLAGILSKRLEDYAFAAARAPWCPSLFVFFWLEGACACQHGLRPGLQRSLIVIAPLALVLGLRGTPRRAPSHPVVLAGSMNSTSRRPILPPSECSVLWFFFGLRGFGTLLLLVVFYGGTSRLSLFCRPLPAGLGPLIAVSICCARCPGITAPAGTGV